MGKRAIPKKDPSQTTQKAEDYIVYCSDINEMEVVMAVSAEHAVANFIEEIRQRGSGDPEDVTNVYVTPLNEVPRFNVNRMVKLTDFEKG